jgi:hypothetical protein
MSLREFLSNLLAMFFNLHDRTPGESCELAGMRSNHAGTMALTGKQMSLSGQIQAIGINDQRALCQPQ